jgi:hypothetical protein
MTSSDFIRPILRLCAIHTRRDGRWFVVSKGTHAEPVNVGKKCCRGIGDAPNVVCAFFNNLEDISYLSDKPLFL